MTLPQGPSQRWRRDFVSDTPIDGRRIRILVVVHTSLSGVRGARELDAVIAVRGVPTLMIVSDNGTELASLAIPRWTSARPVEWH